MAPTDENAENSKRKPAKTTPERLFTGVFIAIIGVTLCCYITGQGLNAGTTVYIDRLGGSATLAGIGAAVFSFAAIVGRLVSGPLADARGRLLVIASGAVILLVGVLGQAITANIDFIMVWRTLQGLGFSAVTTATATAAADVLPVDRLGEGIGYYGLGQALAMSVGPALAIALVSTDPPENLFWGLSIAAAISLFLCVFCRYERNPEKLPETSTYRTLAAYNREMQQEGQPSEKLDNDTADSMLTKAQNGSDIEGEPTKNRSGASTEGNAPTGKQGVWVRRFATIAEPGALAGGIPMMILSPAFGFGIFFVGLLGTQLGIGNAGIFYTISAVSMIVVRLSSKAFMDRALPIRLFGLAVVSGLICFTMLLVVSLPFMGGLAQSALFYAAGIFYGLCLGISLPVNQTVAVKNSPAERWGAANGLFMLLFDVGIGLASVMWGITNDHFGFTFTIVCVLVLVAASFLAALASYPSSAKRKQRSRS